MKKAYTQPLHVAASPPEDSMKPATAFKRQPLPIHQRTSKLDRFLFGCPYYPEHWTEAERKNDAALMAAAGVNIVRLAEFAWDLIEPRRNAFDFSLFDNTIRILGKKGVRTMLCTPTAAPPRWLTQGHDDWMRVDADGRRMAHGSRQQCCTNNPQFRAQSRRITAAMARHFARNPHVAGWQTDNELFCHFSECYCTACANAFRQWLRKKYGTIAALNTAWGTRFWSQTYSSFAEVALPYAQRPTYPNPSHLLDYYRFLSDGVIEFQREQVAILRRANSSWWITHNGLFGHIDYWKFSRDLNFMGVDVYPGFAAKHPDNFFQAALSHEDARAVSGTFIVPEQQSGAGGQRPYLHETPQPGQMRLWAYQSIAHGADGILHFRWRTCRFGAEIYWNGILDHDNVPRRRYREFAQEGEEFNRIGSSILGTSVLVKAAVLLETEQDEAHDTMHMGLPYPREQRSLIYAEMLRRHLPAGVVHAYDSFDGLDLIIIPSFELMDSALAGRLEAFARSGGTVVAAARTATRDRNNQVIASTPPGMLSGLFGCSVEEFGKLASPELVIAAGRKKIEAGGAYEILRLSTAKALGMWETRRDKGPHAAPGTPAIAVNRHGKGFAVYIGTYFSAANVAALTDIILSKAAVRALGTADDCVEITCRHADGRKVYFALNHYPEPKSVSLSVKGGTELISGNKVGRKIRLPAYGVAVVETAGKTSG